MIAAQEWTTVITDENVKTGKIVMPDGRVKVFKHKFEVGAILRLKIAPKPEAK